MAFILLWVAHITIAQDIDIQFGESSLALNDKFTITLYFPKDTKKEFKALQSYLFPDIADFEKGRTLFSDLEDPRAYSITQFYNPLKPGKFDVPPFLLKLKDKTIESKRFTLNVSPINNPSPETFSLSIEDELSFEETKLDAFLELSATKRSIVIGEGVGISLSLFIALQNKAEITFFDLEAQRKAVLSQLRKTGCLLEEFPIPSTFTLDSIQHLDKPYLQWKLFEGVFFPTTTEPIKIPSLSLRVFSYAKAKNKSHSIERRTLEKMLITKPMSISVKPIPNQGEREFVPVGYFKLNESTYPSKYFTGKSFKYTFQLIGEGNIAGLPPPGVISSPYFDIYAPKVSFELNKQQGKVYGVKSFVYYVTPKEPGEFALASFIQWPYFNPSKNSMDTLRPTLNIKVRGESLKNNYISVNNLSSVYEKLTTDYNILRLIHQESNLKTWATILLSIMFGIALILVIKK